MEKFGEIGVMELKRKTLKKNENLEEE